MAYKKHKIIKQYPLGRLELPPDHRDYKLENIHKLSLRGYAPPPQKVYRKPRYILNQDDTAACVGFAWTHLRIGPPYQDLKLTNADGLALYCKARAIRGDAACDKYAGTDTRAGAQAAQAKGYISTYAFTYNVRTVERHVKMWNGVIVGIPWYSDMFTPDSRGFIKPGGDLVGGHEVYVCGADSTLDPLHTVFQIANSWGDTWGQRGFCYIMSHDLQYLINRGGEAATVVELPLPKALIKPKLQTKEVCHGYQNQNKLRHRCHRPPRRVPKRRLRLWSRPRRGNRQDSALSYL